MRKVVTLVLVSLLTACATPKNPVHERQAYWQQVLSSEVPLGSDRAAVLKWAEGRSIHLAFSPEHHQLQGSVEYIPLHQLFCNGYSITLELTLAADDTVSRESVKTYGNCV